jgi:hypothetical protein
LSAGFLSGPLLVTVDGQIAPSTSASKPRVRLSPHEAPQ